MNVTNDGEQTARNIAVARSIDVDHASGIAPRDTDEVKSKSDGEKGMGRVPGFNLAEDSRGSGFSKIVEQPMLFKERMRAFIPQKIIPHSSFLGAWIVLVFP